MKHYYFLFFFLLTSIFAFSQDGCIDLEACNYNETATEDDGSCTYANACVYSAGTWTNENAGNIIDNTKTGISLYGNMRLMDDISLFGRYDDLSSEDADGSQWNLDKDGSLIIFGIYSGFFACIILYISNLRE